MRDELYEPLRLVSGAATAPPAGRWRAAGRTVLAAAALAAAIGLVTLARRDSPLDGEPYAVAKVEVAPAPSGPAAPDVTASVHEAAIASADQVEAASGVKVTRPGGGGPPNARIIDVERALADRLNAAPDPRLVETSRYGPLPRVGADGARPFEVYARPALLDPKLKAGAPRIALMVGGLGLNAEGAEAAIAKLPGAVTLGFAPYGAGIEERAAEAREAGHETALQAPMEDFSHGTGEPGPHTLKTSASDADNLDSLRWLMSRFAGYVAVVNHLGGKFTADTRELTPVLTEIAARGLGYLDDGASPRSVAPDVAAALAMPSARADVVIDANPTPEAIEAALARLLESARERGSAIGVASASPMSVALLARWTNGLESKGVALVPLSALMSTIRANQPVATRP
ncbi:MAG: divergent polysaccharide deacetylase family protein [Roseiarcus sp.]|uniref:divergent polysaccharide deacetylase family protein n=1 Tax=Roseiarcus sp. TaxID=1969460 RepID=UPI003C4EE5A0